MNYSPPGSSVHGIFQARILEWAAISFNRGSSQPRDPTGVSCIPGRFFYCLSYQESPNLHQMSSQNMYLSISSLPSFLLCFPPEIFFFTIHIQHFLETYFLSSWFFAQMVKYSMYYSALFSLKSMTWRACQISRKLHFLLLAKQHFIRVPLFAGHFKWLLPIFCNCNMAVSNLVPHSSNRYHLQGDCPTVELLGQRVSGWYW